MNTTADAVCEFEWTVAPEYEWLDWLDNSGKAIVVPREGLESPAAVELAWNMALRREYGPVLRQSMRDGIGIRRYRPMQGGAPRLFHEFAELDYTSPSSMLEFARAYGTLGVPVQSQFVRVQRHDGELHVHHTHGEPFLRWALEVCLMREGLRLAGQPVSSEAAGRLRWLFDRSLQHVHGCLAFGRGDTLTFTLQPLTLLAAMWLQLALAIEDGGTFVRRRSRDAA